MSDRKSRFLVALALAGGLFTAGAAQAGGVNWSVNINVPGVVYAEPGYYAPPPVYYAPPPVYYQPRPVVVHRPPVVVYHSGRPAIVGGSWERHREHRHHRHHRHGHRHDRHDRHDGDRGHYGGRR